MEFNFLLLSAQSILKYIRRLGGIILFIGCLLVLILKAKEPTRFV